jgi:LacI family sucrose operon transcriptional repressor
MAEAITRVPAIIDDFKPSILVCATDNIAMGAIKAAHLKGIRVPEDLSVTGFGGYEVTEIIHPSLTTVKFFYKEAGQVAAQSMVRLLNSEEVSPLILSKFKIIERESVDTFLNHPL